ncbi:hypothetical protein RND81_09G222700 [Saponaria officinalis]|uniref:Aminotransferase-like plant mobile domain-containing protein n=1 Tax=Saponaria officinalis TaxID=3572 RepID=A0AAW1IP37_SAPOF
MGKTEVMKLKRQRVPGEESGQETESEDCEETAVEEGSGSDFGSESGEEMPKSVATRKKWARKTVESYCSPRGLFTLIEKLSAKQRESVQEIGFGGLLLLKANAFYNVMLPFLLESYHKESRMFVVDEMNKCVLTPQDMYDVFMLPLDYGNKVEVASRKRKDNPDLELLSNWRGKFCVGPKEEVLLDVLAKSMIKMTDGGDEFKQLFVLYAMGTLLAPTAHKNVDLLLTKAVNNVVNIANLDWCSYVLDQLGFVVDKWKKKKTKNVGGCTMFLQIVYFQRMCWKGRKEPSDIPLIQNWTYDKMRVRVDEEWFGATKPGGRFGMGVWDNSTYPISRSSQSSTVRPQQSNPVPIVDEVPSRTVRPIRLTVIK